MFRKFLTPIEYGNRIVVFLLKNKRYGCHF